MNGETRRETLVLQRLLSRAQQAGLMVGEGNLSRPHRSYAFALHRLTAELPAPVRPPIDFRRRARRQLDERERERDSRRQARQGQGCTAADRQSFRRAPPPPSRHRGWWPWRRVAKGGDP